MRFQRHVHSSKDLSRAVCSLVLLGASFAGAGDGTWASLSTPSAAIPAFQRPRPVLRTLLQGAFDEDEFMEWARHATHDDMQRRIDDGMEAHRLRVNDADPAQAGQVVESGGNDTALALLSRAVGGRGGRGGGRGAKRIRRPIGPRCAPTRHVCQVWVCGARVWGSWFRDSSLRFRLWCLGFGVWSLGFRVQGKRASPHTRPGYLGFGGQVRGFGDRVRGLGLEVCSVCISCFTPTTFPPLPSEKRTT